MPWLYDRDKPKALNKAQRKALEIQYRNSVFERPLADIRLPANTSLLPQLDTEPTSTTSHGYMRPLRIHHDLHNSGLLEPENYQLSQEDIKESRTCKVSKTLIVTLQYIEIILALPCSRAPIAAFDILWSTK